MEARGLEESQVITSKCSYQITKISGAMPIAKLKSEQIADCVIR